MPQITIDGKTINIEAGSTILDAARKLKIFIPTICHLDGFKNNTACMACVVAVEGRKQLLPSCAAPAQEGMIVRTTGKDLTEARRTAIELLLGDHTGDCEGPCHIACPAKFSIPEFLRLIKKGSYKEAENLAASEIVLPQTLGYICPAPCQKVCRRNQHDASVAIRLLHRSFSASDIQIPKDTNAFSIAIIGAGPAGLATAYKLTMFGYHCNIYDIHNNAGGKLQQLVSSGKIPANIFTRETNRIIQQASSFTGNTEIDRDMLQKLKNTHDAVLLTTGIASPRMGIQLSEKGYAIDKVSFMTSEKSIFAAGSAINGECRMAVSSIASGIKAAEAIKQFLSHTSQKNQAKKINVKMGKVSKEEMHILLQSANNSDTVANKENGIKDSRLAEEAARCLHCDCRAKDNCRLREMGNILDASPSAYRAERKIFSQDNSHPDIIYEPGKCIVCGLCIQAAQREGERTGHTFIGRGFSVQVGPPFNKLIDTALQTAGISCVEACPTGALSIRDK